MKNHNLWFLVLLVVILVGGIIFWSRGARPELSTSNFQEPDIAPFITPPPGPPRVNGPTTPPPTNPSQT